MSYKNSCSHLDHVTNIPLLLNFLNSKKNLVCSDCDYAGQKLWICLNENCLKLGCSDQLSDHSTLHFTTNPSHCVHMNLKSQRLWCYVCNREVFMDTSLDSSKDDESTICSPDTTLKSCESLNAKGGNVHPPEKNVGSGGDYTDSSESEDSDNLGLEKPAGLVGLQNIGNTCYMNAALQALSNATPLTRFFLDCPLIVQALSEGKKPGLSRIYQSLMRDIWLKKSGGFVSASGILYGIRTVHPMFRGYHQHDTQEFLRNFMDQLHEELKQQCAIENTHPDTEHYTLALDDHAVSSSHDSSEGEYETCDSGVSERSSLSDDNERPSSTNKRRLSNSTSPGRRLKARHLNSGVIDCQPSTSSSLPNSDKPQVKYRSIISDIFDGKLLSTVQCLTCNRISSRVETFQDLSLPIPSRDYLVLLHGRSLQPGSTCSEAVIPVQDGWMAWIFNWFKSWFYGPTITLHDCLAAFFSTDELKGDNMYSCEKCNKLRNGIKFSKVLLLPEVLCIHLKRFRHELMFSSKISLAVSFPLSGLEMKPYLHSDCVSKVTSYELFSVICHHGTAGGGHYISYALNDGQWYEFDDQYVTRVSAEKVENCEAYVLFYRKSMHQADEIKMRAIELSDMIDDVDKEVAYVSKQWMNRFNTCAEPGPIDNSDFLCQHGSMNPDKVLILNQVSLVLPLGVYEYLHRVYGGCPPITCVHVCPCCQAFNKRLLLEMETFVQLSTEAHSQDSPLTHLLSVSWYNQWHNFVNKKVQESPGPIDNSKINLNDIDLNECVNVPEEIWLFFYNIYGGGPELRIKPPTPEMSDSENVEEEVSEADIEFVIPTLRRKPEVSLDRKNYCHGEPVDLGGCKESTVETNVENEQEGEEPSLDPHKCSNGDEDVPKSNNSNLLSSRSTNCMDDSAGFDCKSNNFQVSHDSSRKKFNKVCLDSN
ncbi:ubiquitin carboxyl-terminal hydrolase 20 [Coccinella septempunctata]|uniref:ubiquitin carboxyl-terminal hydrolase 20 n=1 Tax=Coccinella septempunctata TaxID=41139 RepID=UPI001D077B07|nr:ubiquitin carboxyl-terminal hydrolase 20 [Coccinella septempunctata]